MNPFLEKLIGSTLRVLIPWLAGKFGASLTDDEVTKMVAEFAPVIAVLAWSYYRKFRDQQKLVTAQRMPRDVTEHEVEAEIRAGNAASVLTPKDQVPV
jgi:hypothetical protein